MFVQFADYGQYLQGGLQYYFPSAIGVSREAAEDDGVYKPCSYRMSEGDLLC